MTRTHVITYSSLPSYASGFSRWVLLVYKPKCARVQALVERIRRDPRFPRNVHTRDTLDFALRHAGWRWVDRQAMGRVWSRYAAWQRLQEKVAA